VWDFPVRLWQRGNGYFDQGEMGGVSAFCCAALRGNAAVFAAQQLLYFRGLIG
jgi:hypothetical protein